MPTSNPPIAAIDIGTNTVLMLIARALPGGLLETLGDYPVVTRLGQDVDRRGALHPDAIARTLAALQQHQEAAARAGARIVAVGTSALRDARNADAFLAPARAILGVDVEIISGQREAQLTFAGATQGLGIGDEAPTVIDIGGGSTEFVRGPVATRDASQLVCASLDVGSVRLSERYGLHDRIDPRSLAQLRTDLDCLLTQLPSRPTPPLVGIAGTVTTLAAVAEGMEAYDAQRIHGLRLPRVKVEHWVEQLGTLSLDERRRLPGMEPGRADVIVAGGVMLERALRRAGANELIVSNGGVRVGLCLEASLGAD